MRVTDFLCGIRQVKAGVVAGDSESSSSPADRLRPSSALSRTSLNRPRLASLPTVVAPVFWTAFFCRCQVTSAAFTKGFLDLEGELTPILVALVIRNNKAHSLLDDTVQLPERKECKEVLDELLNLNVSFRDASDDQLALVDALFRCPLQPVQLACLKEIDNPWQAMQKVRGSEEAQETNESPRDPPRVRGEQRVAPCSRGADEACERRELRRSLAAPACGGQRGEREERQRK
ncbi:hypothetical protein TGP89_421990 [Toxoplasma gondii p89]|uniref:Uncharacterized protein n=1 Tax=Toxoplasma gondii p89 TaxID=943119 RepID=A0A086J6H9_TOXGO|nr:hypothetical protein TGP89_421990 [Toxoplasma gondii p89]